MPRTCRSPAGPTPSACSRGPRPSATWRRSASTAGGSCGSTSPGSSPRPWSTWLRPSRRRWAGLSESERGGISMEISLDGKRAVVTGASSGIGKAIALALGRAGARVVLDYVAHPNEAEDVAALLRSAGSLAPADISDPTQVASLFAAADRAWGGVDILVNNAGLDGERGLGWDVPVDAWRRVLEVNLVGSYFCAREALRRMVAQRRGVVLTITSVHQQIPWTGYSAYAASKAALDMLTRTLAQEAAPFGVRVLALAPGAIQTAINEAVWRDPRSRADLLSKIPMGRLGQPDEVARMATVLVSDAASYVTGTTLFVDGGMTLYASFMHGG